MTYIASFDHAIADVQEVLDKIPPCHDGSRYPHTRLVIWRDETGELRCANRKAERALRVIGARDEVLRPDDYVDPAQGEVFGEVV